MPALSLAAVPGRRARTLELAAEIERRGIGHDRVLFASDEPWSDREGELARMVAAVGDGELGRHVFHRNFQTLYG